MSIIVEIYKDGIWEYVPEVPPSLYHREDDRTFNFLGYHYYENLKMNGYAKGPEPKGLPEDLSGQLFQFESNVNFYKKQYRNNCRDREEVFVHQLPNGLLVEKDDICLKKFCDENPEADIKIFKIPFAGLYPTFETYMIAMARNGECEYNEMLDDWGYWGVDFSNYTSPDECSFLTLKELLDADFNIYIEECFKSEGITSEDMDFPSLSIVKKYLFNKKANAIINLMTIKKWRLDILIKQPLFKGIRELQKIAEKYDVLPKNIRIVYMFDC